MLRPGPSCLNSLPPSPEMFYFPIGSTPAAAPSCSVLSLPSNPQGLDQILTLFYPAFSKVLPTEQKSYKTLTKRRSGIK